MMNCIICEKELDTKAWVKYFADTRSKKQICSHCWLENQRKDGIRKEKKLAKKLKLLNALA
jgi:hypothetical protein